MGRDCLWEEDWEVCAKMKKSILRCKKTEANIQRGGKKIKAGVGVGSRGTPGGGSHPADREVKKRGKQLRLFS